MVAWWQVDPTQLKLEPAVAKLLGQRLAHIEVVEGELVALRAENQTLRDEIARLKGQKVQAQFKTNQPSRTSENPIKKAKPEQSKTA